MQEMIVKQICAQLEPKTFVKIRNSLDLDLFYEGDVEKIPPELMFLNVIKFKVPDNRCELYVR